MGRRMAVRAFKYGSLVLAVVGVAVLLLVARRSQAPLVEVGRLQATMNWAYVRLAGVVIRPPSLDAESGTLTFWVGDGTGEILVMAYHPEAGQLVAQGALPVMGDGVALEGTLRIKEDLTYLVVNVPESVRVLPAEPLELAVADMTASNLYQRVTIQGVIRDDRKAYEGLRILTVRDASGEIEVALYWGTAIGSEPWPELHIGQAVRVTGAVDQYRGSPQLTVSRGSDVAVLEETLAIAPERRIGQLSAMARGELAVVEGTIVQAQAFSSGVKLGIDDGTGTVTLLLWQDVYDSYGDRERLVKGTMVRVLGEVAEYRGELEIVPDHAQDVMILAAAEAAAAGEDKLTSEQPTDVSHPALAEPIATEPATLEPADAEPLASEGQSAQPTSAVATAVTQPTAAEPGATERHLGEISAEDSGQLVQVEGVLRSQWIFSAGVKGLLDDGTGTVILLLWQDVWEALPDPDSLAPGAVLQVEGEVSVYEGKLRIIPRAATDIVVVDQVNLGPQERELGQITAGDVGQTAQVVGSIVQVQFFSKGVQYVLDDGSGQITLLLWQNVLEEVAFRHDLAPGSLVRIIGEIDEYEGKLEIVPGSSKDIHLMSRGERLPIEERMVNTISAADEGRIFVVTGRVIRLENDGWLRLWIEDGTGELLVFVPQRVVDYMPAGIGPGIRLWVTGEVDIYQAQLELIPLAGADIEVP
jgi:DNA/RNA endonuclease YhcR with UshA esterase domain